MAGLDPAIHVFASTGTRTWMPGPSPGMTKNFVPAVGSLPHRSSYAQSIISPGAILLTGYLGGVIASHVRIDSPLFSHTMFGLYLGLILWGGLWLRDPSLRSLLPFRR